jgi:hypothetical protein
LGVALPRPREDSEKCGLKSRKIAAVPPILGRAT